MNTTESNWKSIPGYEGEYEASSCGRVRSIDRTQRFVGRWGLVRQCERKGKLKNTKISKSGYLLVSLRHKETHHVGRLVGLAHVPGFSTDLEINHIDGNKLNNSASNLEWVTKSGNQRHRYDVLKKMPESQLSAFIKHNAVRKIDAGLAESIRNTAGSCREVAAQFGVSKATVHRVRTQI